MTILTKTQIIGLFENGDVPSGTDFANWILSCITAAETSAQSMTGDLNVAGTLTAGAVSAASLSIATLTVNQVNASAVSCTRVSANTGQFVNISYSGSLGGSSDRRLKTEIKPLGDVLGKIRRLNPVSFQKLENLGHTEYGVVAQELRDVFPELVLDTDPLAVNYIGLIGILLRAVQQLDERTAP